MKIASLLPSATEIVCELGLLEHLVAVSHECDFPPEVLDLPKATRSLIPHNATSREIDHLVRERLRTQRALYTLDMDTVSRLQPDVMVTQALCDVCAVAEDEVNAAACILPGRPKVINLEPMNFGEVLDCIHQIGSALGLQEKAAEVRAALDARVDEVRRRNEGLKHRPRVAMVEWIDPMFNAGHWTPEIVRLAGGHDAVGFEGQPSATTPWERFVDWQPEVLVLAVCGYSVERTLVDLPMLEQYPGYPDLPCVKSGRVYVLDGSAYFSRPGPRLVESLEILAHILHPDRHPAPVATAHWIHWTAAKAEYPPQVTT